MVCGHSPVHVCVWDRPDIPVIYTAPWSPGPYKNPWTSKDPWPALRGCSESLLRIDPWGRFSVTAWRTLSVFVQKKGIVQATTVKLVFSGAELTSGCNYLCECAAVVASLSDKCSVTHRQCWGSCCSITSSVCCVNLPVLRMGIYSVLVHIFMSISTCFHWTVQKKKHLPVYIPLRPALCCNQALNPRPWNSTLWHVVLPKAAQVHFRQYFLPDCDSFPSSPPERHVGAAQPFCGCDQTLRSVDGVMTGRHQHRHLSSASAPSLSPAS